MPEKTPAAAARDGLLKGLLPTFKEADFRKSGTTFSRSTADGVTHVVNFQLGSFDPPGTHPIPGFRFNLYGKFTVNLGVYLPEIQLFQFPKIKSGPIREYDCFFRVRLGRLGSEEKDIWWTLERVDSLTEEIVARLHRDGFPFLNRFSTRDAILQELEDMGRDHRWMMNTPKVARAAILFARGDSVEARALLQSHVAERRPNGELAHLPGQIQFVNQYSIRIGLGPLDV
jgi:hypothetical protein